MELPGKSLIKGHHSGGESDGRAVSAMWGAVAGAADKLQDLGETGMQMADRKEEAIPKAKVVAEAAETPEQKNARTLARIQEVTTQSQAAEVSREIDERIRSHQARVAQNKDMTEDQAEEDWYKSTKDLSEKYGSDSGSPLAVHSQSLIRSGATIARQTVGTARLQRVKLSAIHTVDLAEKTGNVEQLEQGLSVLRHFTPDEKFAEVHKQSYRRMQTHEVENSIGSDPYVMRDELAKPDFLKKHAYLTADDLPRLQAKAEGVARQSVGDSVNSFNQDLLGDKLKSKEDVARVYGDIAPPHVVEEMQNQYVRRHDRTEAGLWMTPEYQRQKSGEVGRMLNGLSAAQGEDFEKNYTAAAFTLSQLEDGPGKSYQMEKLKSAMAGRPFRPKDRKQAAFAELDNQIAGESGRSQPLVRMRTGNTPDGAVTYGGGRPLRESRADLAHPEDEDDAISHQLDTDSRAGGLHEKLSTYFEINPDATVPEIEKQILDLHREVVSGNRAAGSRFSLPGYPDSPPTGGNLFEVVKNFPSVRPPSAAGQGGGAEGADQQLATQLTDARAKVEAVVSRASVTFSEHEKDALASFTQDQGQDRLLQLLDHGKRSKGEIASSLLRYRNKDGRRSQELSRRREAERALFLRGYQQGV